MPLIVFFIDFWSFFVTFFGQFSAVSPMIVFFIDFWSFFVTFFSQIFDFLSLFQLLSHPCGFKWTRDDGIIQCFHKPIGSYDKR